MNTQNDGNQNKILFKEESYTIQGLFLRFTNK